MCTAKESVSTCDYEMIHLTNGGVPEKATWGHRL